MEEGCAADTNAVAAHADASADADTRNNHSAAMRDDVERGGTSVDNGERATTGGGALTVTGQTARHRHGDNNIDGNAEVVSEGVRPEQGVGNVGDVGDVGDGRGSGERNDVCGRTGRDGGVRGTTHNDGGDGDNDDDDIDAPLLAAVRGDVRPRVKRQRDASAPPSEARNSKREERSASVIEEDPPGRLTWVLCGFGGFAGGVVLVLGGFGVLVWTFGGLSGFLQLLVVPVIAVMWGVWFWFTGEPPREERPA